MAFGILCTATAEICFAKWAIVGAGDTGQSIDGGGHEGVGSDAVGGTGGKGGTGTVSCGVCRGRGRVQFRQGFFAMERPCPECQGHQWVMIDGDEMKISELEVE